MVWFAQPLKTTLHKISPNFTKDQDKINAIIIIGGLPQQHNAAFGMREKCKLFHYLFESFLLFIIREGKGYLMQKLDSLL